MGETINLNRVRKARARAEAAAEAARNRVRFGRTRAERDAHVRSVEHAERALEAHRREPGD